jgi:hypothetical protein
MASARRLESVLGHLAPASPGASPVVTGSPVAFAKKPVKVVVTGAAGNIAYAILFQIGQVRRGEGEAEQAAAGGRGAVCSMVAAATSPLGRCGADLEIGMRAVRVGWHAHRRTCMLSYSVV